MHETGKKLLNLMFRPGETVCVSHNKYGYHSIPLQNALEGPVTLVPPQTSEDQTWRHPKPEELLLVALNPIKGWRQDMNCTAFRSFLVEMDYGPLAQQLAYAKRIGLPYSAVIFSGNKSLHFLITLDSDLPDEETWRKIAEWILGVATMADQKTKNPSRSIRIPGAFREPDKQQKIVEFHGAISLKDLGAWLSKHPEAKPVVREKRVPSGKLDFDRIKPWCRDLLINGLKADKGRNQQWFAIACEFALAGFSEDDTLDILSEFFSPDRDFKEREWKRCIRSGFEKIYSGK
jgi:hypothetical protein